MVTSGRTVAVAELKANFAQTLRDVHRGGAVTVAKHGEPLATLWAVAPPADRVAEPRARYDGENGLKVLDHFGECGHNRVMYDSIVSVADAKANLSKYVKIASSGLVVVISSRNVPVAELRPIPRAAPRRLGILDGSVEVLGGFELPDSFFEPLIEEESAGWEDDEPTA